MAKIRSQTFVTIFQHSVAKMLSTYLVKLPCLLHINKGSGTISKKRFLKAPKITLFEKNLILDLLIISNYDKNKIKAEVL